MNRPELRVSYCVGVWRELSWPRFFLGQAIFGLCHLKLGVILKIVKKCVGLFI